MNNWDTKLRGTNTKTPIQCRRAGGDVTSSATVPGLSHLTHPTPPLTE